MYCMKCGAQNDDQAAFCAACGAPFPTAQSPAAQPVAPSQQPVHSYLVEMAAGEHKHLLNEFVFKEPDGTTGFTVKRTSMIHENYDIQDAGGQVVGRMNHKTSLTQTSMEVYDSGQKLACVVHFKGHQPGSAFPGSWLEDPSGSRVATVTYSFPINFEVSRPDGSLVFGATVALEGGLLHEIRELGLSRCNVQVLEAGFPLWQVAGIFVAVDDGRRMVGRSHSNVRI